MSILDPFPLPATRYVKLNSVRAKIATNPTKYTWSSAGAHIRGRDNDLVKVRPLLHGPKTSDRQADRIHHE